MTPGITMGVGAPLYLPTPGTPPWIDPRLFAQDEEEWLALDYKMPTEPLEVVAIVRSLSDVPPVLAPFVRVVGWIVAEEPEPPLPTVPVLWVPNLPRVLPADPIVILDANAGQAYIQPNAELLARYQSQLLRTATHTRYHLEGVHLPIQTWDGHKLEVGAIVSKWSAVESAVQMGADFVMVSTTQPPRKVPDLAHRLGGKPLWWRLNPAWAFQTESMNLLWRWGAEMNLTVLIDFKHDWQLWWNAMLDEREILRKEHRPIGKITLCLHTRVSHHLRDLDELPLTWLALELPNRFTARTAERSLFWSGSATDWGLRKASLLKQVSVENLAIVLAGTPHAIIVPADTVQETKRLVARLGIRECTEWLWRRIDRWNAPDLIAMPDQWVQERS